MPISPKQASEALSDIASAEGRSATIFRYRLSAPYLLLWGALWVVGFSLSDFYPAQVPIVWLCVTLIGIAGSIAVSLRAEGVGRAVAWRCAGVGITITAFVFATVIVLRLRNADQISALAALIVAMAYVLIGLWIGARFVITGIVVGALTVAGSFLFSAHFSLWMAAVGGGALIFAGLWLRQP